MLRRVMLPLAFALWLAAPWAAALATAQDDPGREVVTLDLKGEKGDVVMNHKQHQQALGECDSCHARFPKEQGVLARNRAQGALEPKSVMKQCRRCHDAMKAGPVEECAGCHKG